MRLTLQQAQRILLGQPVAAVPSNAHPPAGPKPLFTWDQIEKIQSVNSELASFDQFSHDNPSGVNGS